MIGGRFCVYNGVNRVVELSILRYYDDGIDLQFVGSGELVFKCNFNCERGIGLVDYNGKANKWV
jgi:hypothetical protein